MTCKICKWWDQVGYHKGLVGNFGFCRRFPPAHKTITEKIEQNRGNWPETFEDDWCGEFLEELLTPEEAAALPDIHMTADEIRKACDSGEITNYGTKKNKIHAQTNPSLVPSKTKTMVR